MIFVTVGTQEPFDRLIQYVDELAPEFLDEEILAQVRGSSYAVKNIRVVDFLSPIEFERVFLSARLVICHAGMGSILTALSHSKPIIVVPRKYELLEHRNDHQMATASKLSKLNLLDVAYDGSMLLHLMHKKLGDASPPGKKLGKYASKQLIESLRDFISKS